MKECIFMSDFMFVLIFISFFFIVTYHELSHEDWRVSTKLTTSILLRLSYPKLASISYQLPLISSFATLVKVYYFWS